MAKIEYKNGIPWVVEPEGEWELEREPTRRTPENIEQKLERIEAQNLLIMDALVDVLAEYPLPETRKTEVDIYTELIELGRRSAEDVPSNVKKVMDIKDPDIKENRKE